MDPHTRDEPSDDVNRKPIRLLEKTNWTKNYKIGEHCSGLLFVYNSILGKKSKAGAWGRRGGGGKGVGEEDLLTAVPVRTPREGRAEEGPEDGSGPAKRCQRPTSLGSDAETHYLWDMPTEMSATRHNEKQ